MNSFQRKFVNELRRADDLSQKLVYLENECDNLGIEVEKVLAEPKVPTFKELIDIEHDVGALEKSMRDVSGHLATLSVKKTSYFELSQVLKKSQHALEISRSDRRSSSIFVPDSMNDHEEQKLQAQLTFKRAHLMRDSDKLNTITGIIRTDKTMSFQTLIWRICGNNALVQFFNIEEAIEEMGTGELVQKNVFLVMCQGQNLTKKIKQICAGYHASIYDIPETRVRYLELVNQIDGNVADINLVYEETKKQKTEMLMAISKRKNLHTWVIKVAKLKAVLAVLNFFRSTDRGFIAECWCAETDFPALREVIIQTSINAGAPGQAVVEVVPTTMTPPTFYRTNKFTQGFQNIVESYGVANYGEVNPAPYTIITFPFLFAVMFGDTGHGLIMFLFALWMVLAERRLMGASNNEIWLTFFNGRYIILLMGLFSMYTGLIYNDVFSKSMNLFGSTFNVPAPVVNGSVEYFNQTMLTKENWNAYPFGVDPVWQISTNKIQFLNSFKMKLSVTLGVIQMVFGVILSLFNHLHFGKTVSIVFEFIPQMIFMLGLFGYLIVLTFAKWLIVFDSTHDAPSILIDFINMFLMKYPKGDEAGGDTAYLKPWYPGKQMVQTALLAAALLCVPVMLLAKPIIMVCCSPRKRHLPRDAENGNGAVGEDAGEAGQSSSSDHDDDGDDEHGDESAGDIFIHQAIHTIEYCLGSISHTASYLRLWALSLAHSQLSDVLWSRLMKTGLSMELGGNLYARAVLCFVVFAIWATLTVAILIVMEGLSAFLHALRLHWVEFQSKFYQGNGYLFKPFKLQNILHREEE